MRYGATWIRVSLTAVLCLGGGLAIAAPGMRLSSAAFAADAPIPQRYTCDGPGVSPPLAWTRPPAGTRSLALVVTDPDAPDPKAPRMTWVHWVIYDLPPRAGALPTGAATPPEARDGLNSWKRAGYGGPCPPIGRHRYFFRLYALDTVLQFPAPPDRARLLAAMHGHVVAEATLMGTYRRIR